VASRPQCPHEENESASPPSRGGDDPLTQSSLTPGTLPPSAIGARRHERAVANAKANRTPG
jgi:hypothetical protein